MSPIKIFVSHSTRYAELARSFKLSLQALENEARLDIRISGEMAGAKNWRNWIEENVCDSDLFLLIYPHASMEMGWPNYELGRFYDGKRPIVCVKNVDIKDPPPAFEPYQAYNADEGGLSKFLNELFVTGVFSNGEPLNAAVGQLGSDFYARAKEVSRELARRFADARLRDLLYERRIVISLAYSDGRLDPERSTVEGNLEGMMVLGHHKEAFVPWSTLRAQLDGSVDWPADLERAIPSIARGALNISLSPFRDAKEILIPVISRASSVDKVLRNIAVIFVPADVERLRPLLDWATPRAMPEQFASLIRVVRMLLRARWDILEPAYRDVRFKSLSAQDCAGIAESVIESLDRMSREAAEQGLDGLDKFLVLFGKQLRPEVNAAIDEYVAAKAAIKAAQDEGEESIKAAMSRLLDNNRTWLHAAAKQFLISVEDFNT